MGGGVRFERSGRPGHREFIAWAPAGYRFDGETHMLVEAGDGGTREEREAAGEVRRRAAEAKLTPCPADCDCGEAAK